ncbi:MAG: LytR cell envelope-related transcriptional attenuator, partial [Solirubrobacterales bacterium]|nr:LytR cell envelope-related transcriptional attenuator [Solirubrobacterales bacterium]
VPAAGMAAPRPEPAVPLRAAPAAALPPLRRPGDTNGDKPSGSRTILAVVGGGVGVIVIAILLVTQVFGGGGNGGPTTGVTSTKASTTPKTTSSASSTTPAVAPPVRGNFSVFVLNGTQRNGAARDAGNKLETSGYKLAGTKTAVTQTVGKTVVAYQPKSKRAALDVAQLLGLTPSSVILADANAIVAGAGANIIVTLGADTVQ